MKTDPQLPNWQLIIKALEALNGRASTTEIKQYFIENFLPEKRAKNVPYDSKSLTVNSPSRVHYAGGKQPRRTDTNNQYDRLFLTADKKLEFYSHSKHGVWEIVKDSNGTMSVKQVSEPNYEIVENGEQYSKISYPGEELISSDNVTTEATQFAMESHLRDYLAQNLQSFDSLNTKLELYVDESDIPGVEYRTDVGNIDILAKGTNNSYYVIELKLRRGPDAVIGQILRYMGWIRSHLASPEQEVYGIVVSNKTTNKLKYAASEVPNIHLMEYELNFTINSIGQQSPN